MSVAQLDEGIQTLLPDVACGGPVAFLRGQATQEVLGTGDGPCIAQLGPKLKRLLAAAPCQLARADDVGEDGGRIERPGTRQRGPCLLYTSPSPRDRG